MFTPTITYNELEEGMLLFYRGDSLFSFFIRLWEVLRYWKWRHFFIAFTHIAQVTYNRELDILQRYDSMEGLKTGFRECIWKAYVFRFIEPLTARELMLWRQYLLARKGSSYDLQWAISTIGQEREDIFGDFCSELTTNALFVAGRITNDSHKTPYGVYTSLRKKLVFIWVIL